MIQGWCGSLPEVGEAWILTASGKKFDLFYPTADMIDIGDIAHALSHVCRFGGHTREFYSVAQHSVIVSRNVPPDQALTALLHDATEAYCGDMVKPLKVHQPAYEVVEAGIWEVVRSKYGLADLDMHPSIKLADDRALQTERRDIMIQSPHVWSGDKKRAEPFEERIVALSPNEARALFLARFEELNRLPF